MDSKRTNVWFILYVIPNTPQNVLAHPSRRQIRKVCHVFLNFIPDEEYLHVVFPSFHSEFRISSWARSTYLKTELSYPHSLIALAPMARNILSRFRLSSVLFFELLFSCSTQPENNTTQKPIQLSHISFYSHVRYLPIFFLQFSTIKSDRLSSLNLS